jgi:hypothetical protein
MTPAFAPKLAKIVTPNVGTAISAKNGSCKWWISRVEVSGIPQGGGVNYNYGLIRFGEDETSLSALPTDLVLDRVYVHGTSSLSVQHAVVTRLSTPGSVTFIGREQKRTRSPDTPVRGRSRS